MPKNSGKKSAYLRFIYDIHRAPKGRQRNWLIQALVTGSEPWFSRGKKEASLMTFNVARKPLVAKEWKNSEIRETRMWIHI